MTSLRSQLAWTLGGLAVLILAVVGGYLGRLATSELLAAQQMALRGTAQAAAELLGTELRNREQEIELLSQAPHLMEGPLDSPGVRVSLEHRKEMHDEFVWLGVANAEGIVVQSTGDVLHGRSVLQRDWFVAARERVYVGDVHEAKLLAAYMPPDPTGDPARFVDFAAPIRDAQGRLRGVVGAHAHWRWATGIVVRELQRLYEAHGVEVLIRKASGEVLYPQALATANARGVAVLPSGALDGEMQMPDGERYLVAQATVETRTHANLGWEIVVREPLDQALQPVQALRRRLIGLGLAVVGLLTWAAYALAARISQPVERLVQYAHAIEAGELAPALPDHAPQELQQLGEAMRSMTESLLAKESELERVNHSLEDQVHDRTAALQAANLALEQLATIDGLTHVHNRRSFDARLLEAHARQRRYPGGAYALLLVDVDHFKRVNDHHGHPAGDAVLQKVAQLLMGAVRVTDFVARFGGEEFAVLLPQVTSTEELAAVGEKVRAAMAGASFPAVGVLTVSVGGSLSQQDDATPLRVVDRADAALYAAKRAGRNQVQIG